MHTLEFLLLFIFKSNPNATLKIVKTNSIIEGIYLLRVGKCHHPLHHHIFCLPVANTCGLLAMCSLLGTINHSICLEWINAELCDTGVPLIMTHWELYRAQ